MTSNQHTPGPWQVVREHPDAETREIFLQVFPEARTLSIPIAELYCARQGSPQAANAQLIAAAPELLRVVQIVYKNDFLSGCISVPGGVKSFKLFVEELLAKVTEPSR